MRLAIIGTGYVGLTTGALFADRGNKVTCVDNNENVVEGLKRGEVHIFEPGLKEIVIRTTSSKDLSFTTDLSGAVKDAEIIFLAVGTPSNDDGSFNLKFVEQAARDVGRAIKNTGGFKIVVGKSTVPQGTHMKMKSLINEELGESPGVEWAYVSNPETLAEGTAVANFSKPDRIMIGTESDQAFKTMQELYHPFIRRSGIILRGSSADAELSKLAANAALAMRVAMINEFARIADKTQGADMENVRIMIGSDDRIGYTFLFPSPGYGGSCFPKDVQGLVHQSKLDGYEPVLLDEVHRSNETHKNYLGERVKALLKQKNNPKIAIWGVTFKAKTDDMRDTASIPN
jgi:UDPglucose 6-dehydrogenase